LKRKKVDGLGFSLLSAECLGRKGRCQGQCEEVIKGTHVHPWRIHVDIWQNQYNTEK